MSAMATPGAAGAQQPGVSRPLKVLIVGAGISGLTAAVGLRREGHVVTLFERSELAREVGAAIHLAPNCNGILRRLGVYAENFGANPVHGIVEFDGGGNVRSDIDLRQSLSIWQHPWVLSHRVRLHEELKRLATSPGGEGTPATLRTSSRVAAVDVDTATVTLEDGTSFSGDLVLGADGVSSVTRAAVVGPDVKPFGSGKSAFRFLMPRSRIRENPATATLAERDGYMYMWVGADRRLVMYPCSDNTVMNCAAIHPSGLSASKGEGWNRSTTKEVLLDVFSGFGGTVRALLGMVDAELDGLRVWTLLDMDRIPSWHKGRLALMGDAAHPFLPHLGQGGGIAIEDAASICVLLPHGTLPDEIPARLALYERIRDERAHKVQHFTRLAGADLADDGSRSSSSSSSDGAKRQGFNNMEFTRYNFGHDEWHNSTRALREHLWRSRDGPAVRWRQPVSFGPMPGPRAVHAGGAAASMCDDDARFTTWSVRFRTSSTYLETLFPTADFSFSGPGTVAEASLVCSELSNLRWLGGGGYRYLGLWIHGVQYTARKQQQQQQHGGGGERKTVRGSFLPVLFESRADPIVTGREELGMPKLFCDIDIDGAADKAGTAASTSIVCSWQGTPFLRMHMGGSEAVLLADPVDREATRTNGATQEGEKQGTLVYRYVPAVGGPGQQPDAVYAVLIPEPSSTSRVVETTSRCRDSRLEFMPGDWESLPTLHHVAAGLAGIPIYGVVEGKVDQGRGVDSFCNAERI